MLVAVAVNVAVRLLVDVAELVRVLVAEDVGVDVAVSDDVAAARQGTGGHIPARRGMPRHTAQAPTHRTSSLQSA